MVLEEKESKSCAYLAWQLVRGRRSRLLQAKIIVLH